MIESWNWAHFHLIVNHFPIVGIPLVLVFLIAGLKLQNQSLKRLSLFMLVLISVASVGIFFSGEAAEEFVENLPGFVEEPMETHEEAAKISLVTISLLGVASFYSYLRLKSSIASRLPDRLVVVLALAAILSLMVTANFGGQIRHSEIIKSK